MLKRYDAVSTYFSPSSRREQITIDKNGQWHIPDNPVIAYIEGDGVGQDISPVMRDIVDSAIEACLSGRASDSLDGSV